MSSSLARIFMTGLSNPSLLKWPDHKTTDLFSAENSVFDISCFKKSFILSYQGVASSNKTIKEQKEPKKPIRFRPNSCVDYLRRGISQSGRYKLYDQTGKTYAAYCDMKSELDTAWTMVMSWTPVNRRLSAFFKIPFKYNSPKNEDAPNWDLYRLSLARMRLLQTHSTHWRATCSYPTHGIDFRDYLRGNFKDFNIFDFVGERQCKKVEYVNIRGHVVRIWRRLSGRS